MRKNDIEFAQNGFPALENPPEAMFSNLDKFNSDRTNPRHGSAILLINNIRKQVRRYHIRIKKFINAIICFMTYYSKPYSTTP